MENFKSFSVTTKKGIDDLISLYPYANAHDWPVWAPAFNDVTEESYKTDVEGYERRVKEYNEKYIADLKESGEYGKEKKTNFTFMSHPEFDDTKPTEYKDFQILIPKGKYK